MSDNRFSKRRRMLDAVNDYFVSKEKADSLKAVDTFYQRAYSHGQLAQGARSV